MGEVVMTILDVGTPFHSFCLIGNKKVGSVLLSKFLFTEPIP
jgi:hypothetical protein